MRTTNLFTTTAFAVLMLCGLTSKATIWRVNNNPNYTQGCNHCFSSLQAANDSSIVMAGDTIHLEASSIIYLGPGPSGETSITKRLVILGPGYFLNQNSGLQKTTVSSTMERLKFDIGSENSTTKGITINTDLYIQTSGITIESCLITSEVIFSNTIDINNVTIKKCFLNIVKNNGTPIGHNISNLILTNSYISGRLILFSATYTYSGEVSHNVFNFTSANQLHIKSDIQFYNNIVSVTLFNQNNNGINNVHDNIFIPSPPAWLVGGNNYSENLATVFPVTGSPDSILNVNPIGICPVCYTAFPGNATFGMYGGADPYRLSGIPNIPAIYQLASPLNAPQGGTINVNISTRSND